MNLNLGKFKKLSENEKSATLMHPAGHKIIIAKSVLSPNLHKELNKLPLHLEKGTPNNTIQSTDQNQEPNASYDPSLQNQDSSQISSQQPTTPQQPTVVINNTPPSQNQASVQSPPPQVTPQTQVAQAPIPDQTNQSGNAPSTNVQGPDTLITGNYNPQNDPYGSKAYSDISKEGIQNQIQGINETATAQGKQNETIAAERQAGAVQQQAQLIDSQKRLNFFREESKKAADDANNYHIDPSHYLNSMGTGQKIATGIGLILGGIGGGLTHQGNPALEFLNKQIANDVESQRQELGKKTNLLTAYMRQFENENQAMMMTEATQRNIVANKIEEAALKTGNPIIQARAKQAIGQLELQNNQLFSQMAVRQTLQGGQNNQNQMNPGSAAQQTDPATKIRLFGQIGYLNPSQTEQAQKELQSAENMEKQRQNLLNAFDRVKETNTLGNWATAPLQTKRSVDAYIEPLLGSLTKETEGRVTPTDIATIRPLFHKVGNNEETDRIARQQLDNMIRQKMSFPMLDSLGINKSFKNVNTMAGNNKVNEGAPVLPQ
jgi:hypothetical protein